MEKVEFRKPCVTELNSVAYNRITNEMLCLKAGFLLSKGLFNTSSNPSSSILALCHPWCVAFLLMLTREQPQFSAVCQLSQRGMEKGEGLSQPSKSLKIKKQQLSQKHCPQTFIICTLTTIPQLQ